MLFMVYKKVYEDEKGIVMDIYSLTEGKFISQLNSVDNAFMKQLYLLALSSAKNKKMVGIVAKNFISNRGEIANRSLSTIDKSILNICQLTPLVDKENCSNLVEDVAKYRWEKLNFNYDKDYWKERSYLLFLDYILSSCLCYVEVFDSGSSSSGKKTNMVDKFYATRNRFIAANVAEIPVGETGKYVNYLTPVLSDYKMESLRVLKLSRQKKGFKITQPRSAINFTKAVKITPIFFINAFLQGITPILKENMIKFKYIKDNGQERELITTLSKDVFTKYYDASYAENIISKCEMKIDRGYLKVPELGCSKYDETGLRALNLSRITSIEIVDEFDSSYIDVDFNSIIPTFKATVEAVKNVETMGLIYQTLLNESPEKKSLLDMRSEILVYVDGRFAIGTSTFQKELHNYMKQYNVVFKGYTGKPTTFSMDNTNNFNLGFE